MKLIRNREVRSWNQHNRQLIEGYELEDCTFDGGAVLLPDSENPDPRLRPTIRNVFLRRTKVYTEALQGAIIEDVTVDTTIGGKHPCILCGNVYRHVTLKGRIAFAELRGKVRPDIFMPMDERMRVIKEWDNANADYYRSVDWALDITQASYASFSISGIPARLIRRNSENTAVVTREHALAGKWRGIDWACGGGYQFQIMDLLDDGYDDVLLIACPRGKHYKDELQDLQLLRDIGVAQ